MAGNPEFGKRVRTLREERKKSDPRFSLRKFAEAVGISPTYLSKVEKGEFSPPSPQNIKKMAELLGIDADELLALANKVDPDLSEIVREQPKAMADLLRTASNMTEEQLLAWTAKMRKQKKG